MQAKAIVTGLGARSGAETEGKSVVYLSGIERILQDRDLIVTKTDPKGRITYANDTFLHFAGFPAAKVIGAPHNLIRHPHMPRCVFKLLWDTLGQGNEIFAYVVNRSANGDHYWVFAHVTPTLSVTGDVIGFHSNRRSVDRRVLDTVIVPLYRQLLDEEGRHADPRAGMAAASDLLANILAKTGKSYDEFVFSL